GLFLSGRTSRADSKPAGGSPTALRPDSGPDGKFAAVLVLAGDIGGTKTALAIVEVSGTRQSVRRLEVYASADHAGLEEIGESFLREERSKPEAAGFGVAGPVRDGVARITKLPWRLEARSFSRRVGIRRVALLNDFVAAALGLPYLKPRQSISLARGKADRNGPIAILAAGTGLGAAAVLAIGAGFPPCPPQRH